MTTPPFPTHQVQNMLCIKNYAELHEEICPLRPKSVEERGSEEGKDTSG